MKIRLFSLLTLVSLLLLAGCAERGDKAIAYGDGPGNDWKPTARGQMRISAQNSFTRDVVVHANAAGKHYEMTVGPTRERYMIVPEAKCEIQAWTREKSTGSTFLFVGGDDRNGAKGLRVLRV